MLPTIAIIKKQYVKDELRHFEIYIASIKELIEVVTAYLLCTYTENYSEPWKHLRWSVLHNR